MKTTQDTFAVESLKNALWYLEKAKARLLSLADNCHARAESPSQTELARMQNLAIIAQGELGVAAQQMGEVEDALHRAWKSATK